MAVFWRREGEIAFVELDNPPVNAMGLELRQGLRDAVQWAEAEGLARVVVSGRGRVFAAGGDAREFDAPPVAPHLPDVLNMIEQSPVPWIAAAHGAALGGGLELMLACKFRVAAPDTRLGLPEVTLGVVPGAGGTQRLPRLIGTDPALKLVALGRTVSAGEALKLGLIDAVADDPVPTAALIGAERLRGPVAERPATAASADASASVRREVGRKMRGQVAPLRAIALVEAAHEMTLEQGLAQERATFLELRGSEQAKALRHVFFAERAARKPDWLRDVAVPELSKIAVVGGGTMGAGIAYALVGAGYRVTLLEADAEGMARARANVERLFKAGLTRGLLTPSDADAWRAALDYSRDYARAANAGLAIEAAFESMEVKKSVLGALQAALPGSAVLATNTSYLDIDEMATALDDPSRLVGLHFFAPAHIMKLLEIVRGAQTADRALALGFDLARRLGKVPVLAGVCEGFIGNRILARYREAADAVMMDGALPWEVDRAMVEFGYAMGPFETQDLSGLDIGYANRRRQDATRDPARRYVPIADRLVEMGRLGKKTGAGWYRYPDGGGKVADPAVAELVIEVAAEAGITRRTFDADEIRHRMLMAMINEAADILHQRIAGHAADIDLVSVFGYGFPRWRGGLMHYADNIGAARVLDALRALEGEDPVAWKPSPLIVECAGEGGRFADWRG